MRALLFVAAISVMGLPEVALAQEPAELPPVEHKQLISTSPLGIVMQWYRVDVERKVAPAATVGFSGSSLDMFEAPLRQAFVFARFYPQRAALSGIYIGARGGVIWNRFSRDSTSTFATGVEIGKTRLLGPKKNIALSSSFGFDRVYVDGHNFAVPNLRLLNIGIAF